MTAEAKANPRAASIEYHKPPHDWSDWLNRFAAARINVSLDFDVDYGLHKREGWSFAIDGTHFSEFRFMPEEAVEEAIAKWIDCGEEVKNG